MNVHCPLWLIHVDTFREYTKIVAIAASNSVLREWRMWHKNAKEGILWWPDGSRQWGETHIRVCLYNWFNMAGTWLGCSDCLGGKSTAAWPHDVLWRFLGNLKMGAKHRSTDQWATTIFQTFPKVYSSAMFIFYSLFWFQQWISQW